MILFSNIRVDTYLYVMRVYMYVLLNADLCASEA